MVRILNGILNPEAQPFVICTNGCHFFQKPFENWILNGDTIAIVEAIALLFENQTISNLIIKKFEWSDFRFLLYF